MAYRRNASPAIEPEESSRIPEKSVFYQRVVPALLIAMTVLTVVLILFAAAVLLGIVRF